jgi:hypothetical protein
MIPPDDGAPWGTDVVITNDAVHYTTILVHFSTAILQKTDQ